MRTTCRYFCAILLLVAAACGDSPVTQPSSPGSVAGMRVSSVDPFGPGYPVDPPQPNLIGMHSWWKQHDRLWGHDPNEGYPGGYELSRPNWFYVSATAGSYAYIQLYRCQMSGWPYRHFMTTSSSCENGFGTAREDLGGIYGIRPGYEGSFPDAVPLYRLTYPGNDDNYVTADEAEKNDIMSNGWQMQGIIAYVWR